ncbi:glycosyltransferase [Pseudomonas syringae]|uniref:glycosyltransferase n=1 Tax=Pseudomonas syringae TaxID=317 RepID=UPI003F74CD4C
MNSFSGDRPLVIGWCVASLSLNVASVRYRAVLPIVALENAGHTCEIFTHANIVDLEKFDVLVVVKDFSVETYGLVQRAHALNLPVVLDLCDNIFVQGYGKNSTSLPRDMFSGMAKYASAIITTTKPLADIISRHVQGVRVDVIPDGVISGDTNLKLDQRLLAAQGASKTPKSLEVKIQAEKVKNLAKSYKAVSVPGLLVRISKRWRTLLTLGFWKRRSAKVIAYTELNARALLANYRKAIVKPVSVVVPKANHNVASLLWFGNHGATYADFGMLDLLLVREALETIAQEYPVELVVVSNHQKKYEAFILPFAISSRYVEWTIQAVEQEMAKAKVVLIPNSRDEFSICKSANRSVHALTRSLPVVATATPSLEPLKGGIATDGFLLGLRRYLSDEKNIRNDVKKGKKLAEAFFSPAVISQSWVDTFRGVLSDTKISATSPTIIFALHLIQDLDVVLPIIKEAQRRSLSFDVWCSTSLLKKSPRVLTTFQEINISPIVLMDKGLSGKPPFNPETKAMLSVAETNLGPHAFTRWLTEGANEMGIVTATMQHGLENVGLTYSDEIHHIQKINFAAQRIYLWGAITSLHPEVSLSTQQKCIEMGCPKPVSEKTANLDHLIEKNATVIGIFENLHWHRYTDTYRKFFIEGVQSLAERFPEIVFLVKPHHAGMWLTTRYKGEQPVAVNLVIANPENPEWQQYTADQLLGRMAAVITSPSTVALDAARRDLSVAVVAHDLETELYGPLKEIRSAQDWANFVFEALETRDPDELSRQFVAKTIIGGPTATKILDNLLLA